MASSRDRQIVSPAQYIKNLREDITRSTLTDFGDLTSQIAVLNCPNVVAELLQEMVRLMQKEKDDDAIKTAEELSRGYQDMIAGLQEYNEVMYSAHIRTLKKMMDTADTCVEKFTKLMLTELRAPKQSAVAKSPSDVHQTKPEQSARHDSQQQIPNEAITGEKKKWWKRSPKSKNQNPAGNPNTARSNRSTHSNGHLPLPAPTEDVGTSGGMPVNPTAQERGRPHRSPHHNRRDNDSPVGLARGPSTDNLPRSPPPLGGYFEEGRERSSLPPPPAVTTQIGSATTRVGPQEHLPKQKASFVVFELVMKEARQKSTKAKTAAKAEELANHGYELLKSSPDLRHYYRGTLVPAVVAELCNKFLEAGYLNMDVVTHKPTPTADVLFAALLSAGIMGIFARPSGKRTEFLRVVRQYIRHFRHSSLIPDDDESRAQYDSFFADLQKVISIMIAGLPVPLEAASVLWPTRLTAPQQAQLSLSLHAHNQHVGTAASDRQID